jgi:hypothetical protein
MNNKTTSQNQQHTIRSRAHSLWEQAGRPHGRELEFWLQAEVEMARETGPALEPAGDSAAACGRRPTARKRAVRIRVGKPIPAAWQV